MNQCKYLKKRSMMIIIKSKIFKKIDDDNNYIDDDNNYIKNIHRDR